MSETEMPKLTRVEEPGHVKIHHRVHAEHKPIERPVIGHLASEPLPGAADDKIRTKKESEPVVVVFKDGHVEHAATPEELHEQKLDPILPIHLINRKKFVSGKCFWFSFGSVDSSFLSLLLSLVFLFLTLSPVVHW